VVVVTLSVLPDIRPVAADQWWRHLLAIQIYQPSGPVEGLYQTWSLCTEISFYVALPLLGWCALGRRTTDPATAWRRQVWLLASLLVVAGVYNVIRLTTDVLPFQANFWLPAYLDWFAAGMALALVEIRSRQPDPPRLTRLGMALGRDPMTSLVIAGSVFAISCTPIAGAYLFTPNTPWQNMIKHELYLVAAFFFLLPAVLARSSRWSRSLSTPLPRMLGLISYGIFLWHLMLLRLLMPAMGIEIFDGHAWQVGAVLFTSTVLVSAVTYRLMERPAQRWAHRF
jgi:peptidoglycan/LPS O-acetylase OafA/YrhL